MLWCGRVEATEVACTPHLPAQALGQGTAAGPPAGRATEATAAPAVELRYFIPRKKATKTRPRRRRRDRGESNTVRNTESITMKSVLEVISLEVID